LSFGDRGIDRCIDRGMNDGVQIRARIRVGQDDIPQGAPVEGAVGLEDAISKASHDGVEDWLARLLELPRDGIGVDPVGAPCLEAAGNRALAGADVAGDGNAQPARGVRRRAAPPR
jgi:hypothetical protein